MVIKCICVQIATDMYCLKKPTLLWLIQDSVFMQDLRSATIRALRTQNSHILCPVWKAHKKNLIDWSNLSHHSRWNVDLYRIIRCNTGLDMTEFLLFEWKGQFVLWLTTRSCPWFIDLCRWTFKTCYLWTLFFFRGRGREGRLISMKTQFIYTLITGVKEIRNNVRHSYILFKVEIIQELLRTNTKKMVQRIFENLESFWKFLFCRSKIYRDKLDSKTGQILIIMYKTFHTLFTHSFF